MVIKSLRDKIRSRFEMSASEVAFQDLHQRGRIAVTFIAHDNASADANLEKVLHFVETNSEATLAGWMNEKLEFDEEAALF
jgi:uncharacterized protein YlxP (DUF503 family)